MPQPEQLLDFELQDVAAGRPPRTRGYASFSVAPAQLAGQGSANWTIVAEAINYGANGNALGARDRLTAFLLASWGRFMGNELHSTIYGGMHLRAWALAYSTAVKRGDADLAAAALRIGAVWFYLILLGECPDGSILHVGFRSGDRPPATGMAWDRAVLALARNDGQGVAQAIALGKRSGAGIAISPQWGVFKALQPALAAFLAQAVAWQQSELPVGLGFATPMHFLTWRGSDGAVIVRLVYLDAHAAPDANGNTGPLMAEAWSVGSIACLPKDGGARIREHLETVTMTLAPDALTYDSDHQGVQILPLPPGLPSKHLVIGDRVVGYYHGRETAGSTVATPPPASPSVPLPPVASPPSPAAPPVDLQAAERHLLALVPGHEAAALRRLALNAIDAGDPVGALAAAGSIRVNPGQQAALDAALVALGGSPQKR